MVLPSPELLRFIPAALTFAARTLRRTIASANPAFSTTHSATGPDFFLWYELGIWRGTIAPPRFLIVINRPNDNLSRPVAVVARCTLRNFRHLAYTSLTHFHVVYYTKKRHNDANYLSTGIENTGLAEERKMKMSPF